MKSNSTDMGKKAVEILDEMESNNKAGDSNLKPNEITFTLAISACLKVGDAKRAELVMGRMEKSYTPPDIRTYNEILNHWSKVGTPKSS